MTLFKHYKGEIYNAITYADHTETGEELVIYEDINGRKWARSAKEFRSRVMVDGKEVNRFERLNWHFDFK